jgi:YHS domain-containing protein
MRLIIYIILIFLLYRIARVLLFPKKTPIQQKNEPTLHGDETVLDPICQSYFPKDEALSVRNGNELTYFCSEECREKFIKSK